LDRPIGVGIVAAALPGWTRGGRALIGTFAVVAVLANVATLTTAYA
jgi:hypothetical protein